MQTVFPSSNSAANFFVMGSITGTKIGLKVVVCASDNVGMPSEDIFSLPVNYL